MSSVLQQTLGGLCFDTGWCYAVFWKLKQRPRTVLTWEDAFYGRKMEDVKADSLATTMPGCGQQICGGLADMEDPIGLSVSKMSYHVYSVGEGIIGRVAFANKHQWVFSSNDKGTVANGVPNRKSNARTLPEKYPSGWEQQFAAGIKTIAVIAVPQGVVQMGSTHVIVEDLKLIGHVRALFGTLQNVPGAFLSDFVSEFQKGGTPTVCPMAVPAPHLPPRDTVLMNAQSPTVARTPSLPANMGVATAGGAAFNANLGCSGVGRLPMMLASQQILTHAHSWPLPPVPGFQENITHFQHSLLDKPGLESMYQSSFPFFKPSIGVSTLSTGGVKENISHFQHSLLDKPGLESMSQSSFPFFKPSIGAPTLSTGGVKVTPPPRTGIVRHLSLSSKASSIALPVSEVPSSQAGHSSFSVDSSLSVSAPMLEFPEYLRTHSQSGPVSRMNSPGPVDGNQVAAELSDIASSIGSRKAVMRTTKENLFGVAGTSGLGNTQSLGCKSLVRGRQPVDARSEAEEPCSGLHLSVGLGRMSAESLQAESTKHLAKCQQLGSSRSTESQPTHPPSVAGQLEQGSYGTKKGPGVVGNWCAGESGQLISLLPIAERSLVDRTSIQRSQCFDKHKDPFLQSRQFGGVNFATEKIQSVSERSSVESSQPREDVSPISLFSHRHLERRSSVESSHPREDISPISMLSHRHLERSTSSTIQQESCVSAETSALQCEQSMQTFPTDNSQMSDLLQLAKEFENADKDDLKDLSCNKLDLHQCISSSLLCDDYFENLQSSKPLLQNLELNSWDSGLTENSIENIFTDELDSFDEFFAWLTKAEKSKNETLPQPVIFASTTDNDEISATFSTQGHGGLPEGKEHFLNFTSGSNALPCQFATTQAECEPTLHTLNADEPFSNCFAKKETFSCKEFPGIQSEPQFDRFVNSRIHPEVPFQCFRSTDGDTELGCQEMAALPPAKRPCKTLKPGMKKSQPEENKSVRSKDRQKMRDRIRELRAIVPDGASCSIEILLEKVLEHTNFLQSMSQNSGKHTQSSTLQSHDRGNDAGACSESTSVNASWVMDSGAQGGFCPIVVENLSQPGQMLVEMLCEEHGIFLEVAHTIRRLGLSVLKGVMEARNNQVWARFVIEGPQDVHRIRVLWSLMQLLGSKAPS